MIAALVFWAAWHSRGSVGRALLVFLLFLAALHRAQQRGLGKMGGDRAPAAADESPAATDGRTTRKGGVVIEEVETEEEDALPPSIPASYAE